LGGKKTSGRRGERAPEQKKKWENGGHPEEGCFNRTPKTNHTQKKNENKNQTKPKKKKKKNQQNPRKTHQKKTPQNKKRQQHKKKTPNTKKHNNKGGCIGVKGALGVKIHLNWSRVEG